MPLELFFVSARTIKRHHHKPAMPDPVLHRRYRAIVGALGWLNQGTRPDISHAYSELSKFVQCPGQKHMDAAEYCLKCLAGTVDLCIHYGRTKDSKIEGRQLNRLWGSPPHVFARSHSPLLIPAGVHVAASQWPANQTQR